MKDILKIVRFKQLYQDSFTDEWVNNNDWDDTNSQNSYNILKEKIQNFEQEAFFFISQSIMSGEYLVKPKVQDTLNEIYSILSDGEILEEGPELKLLIRVH